MALSTSAESVARRVLTLIGVGGDDRFQSFAGRVEHRDELDARMAAWIAERSCAEVLVAFEEAEAAIAPVFSMADVFADPHYAARQAIVDLEGTPMQNVIARLSATPGRLRWAGRPLGADSQSIRDELTRHELTRHELTRDELNRDEFS